MTCTNPAVSVTVCLAAYFPFQKQTKKYLKLTGRAVSLFLDRFNVSRFTHTSANITQQRITPSASQGDLCRGGGGGGGGGGRSSEETKAVTNIMKRQVGIQARTTACIRTHTHTTHMCTKHTHHTHTHAHVRVHKTHACTKHTHTSMYVCMHACKTSTNHTLVKLTNQQREFCDFVVTEIQAFERFQFVESFWHPGKGVVREIHVCQQTNINAGVSTITHTYFNTSTTLSITLRHGSIPRCMYVIGF